MNSGKNFRASFWMASKMRTMSEGEKIVLAAPEGIFIFELKEIRELKHHGLEPKIVIYDEFGRMEDVK